MSVEEVTTESWSSRLGSSFKGVLAGGALFLGAIPLLFWNEGRAVKTTKALEEGESVCVSVPSVDTVDAANEGKLIHATGTAASQDVLSDDLFSAINMKAMKLRRQVEYYQWVENQSTREEKQIGGSVKKVTTYSYNTKWVSSPVDSSQFKEKVDPQTGLARTNTVFYQGVTDKSQQAQNVTFGAFTLTQAQIGRISGDKPVALSEIQWPADLAGRTTVQNDVLYIGAPQGGMYMQPGMMNKMTPAPGMQPGVMPPGMVQTVATQPVPVANIAVVPKLVNGGFVTVPTIQPNRMSVTMVDGVSFIITPDGNATPVMPNGIYYAGTLHAVTEVVAGNGFEYPAAPVVRYVNIPNYGSLPLFTIENKQYVRLATGAVVPYVRVDVSNGQIVVNGAPVVVTVSSAPEMQAPAYNTAPAVQPGVVQPGVPAVPAMSTANPSSPQVGDVRIKWTYVPETMPISLVSQQTGNTFSPYVADNGYEVDLLRVGTHNKKLMFQKAHDENTMLTWILRFVGWFMMFMGLKMVLNPLSVLGDVLPILGSIISFGIGVIAFFVASIVALVVIAIAWLFYRPLLAIVLLAAAGGLVYLLIKRKKKSAATETTKETDNTETAGAAE